MTRFEKILRTMTLEELIDLNVKLITVNDHQLFWVTSSGQLFNYHDRESALSYEYAYLTQEMDEPIGDEGEEAFDENPDCSCDRCSNYDCMNEEDTDIPRGF